MSGDRGGKGTSQKGKWAWQTNSMHARIPGGGGGGSMGTRKLRVLSVELEVLSSTFSTNEQLNRLVRPATKDVHQPSLVPSSHRLAAPPTAAPTRVFNYSHSTFTIFFILIPLPPWAHSFFAGNVVSRLRRGLDRGWRRAEGWVHEGEASKVFSVNSERCLILMVVKWNENLLAVSQWLIDGGKKIDRYCNRSKLHRFFYVHNLGRMINRRNAFESSETRIIKNK